VRKRVLVLIDQASRDGISQLLIVAYLRRKGVKVSVANQHTFTAMFEGARPDVTYVSWHTTGPLMEFLLRNRHRSRIALIDQEGGRVGEQPFRRSFKLHHDGIKESIGRAASKIFVWGPVHARWLVDMGIAGDETISVVGSPRFDPYLLEEPALDPKYMGVTLRGDAITSNTAKVMRVVYQYAELNWQHGIGTGYPVEAQYEDKIWHVVASMRYLFKTASAFSKHSGAPIVFRPGPWEQTRQYDFVPTEIPRASVDPSAAQHDYVRNAFALLDESSSLGLEGLLVGVPVVSIQRLIPRLADHIAGTGGGLYEAPYVQCYWRPTTIDEAVELLLRAERGELAASPNPDELKRYLHDYHCWPRERPSSFQIADQILKLLDAPSGGVAGTKAHKTWNDGIPSSNRFAAWAATDGKIAISGSEWTRGTELVFRYVPGAVVFLTAKCFAKDLISPLRAAWFRYHYYPWVYRHRDHVRGLFKFLWQRHEESDSPPTETSERV
jgi:surface carbohydrate biosynthesis protein